MNIELFITLQMLKKDKALLTFKVHNLRVLIFVLLLINIAQMLYIIY